MCREIRFFVNKTAVTRRIVNDFRKREKKKTNTL